MKIILSILSLTLVFSLGCTKKKPQADMDELMKSDPHAGMNMSAMSGDPHGEMTAQGGLDLDAMLGKLPEGWSKTEPSNSMRLAQIVLAPAKGDKSPGELAVFHFPGTGGSAAANIERWQFQFQGPNGEPGPSLAKTDTMMVGLLTVVTTDLSGTQLGSEQAASMGTGPGEDMPNSRMIASVIETPMGNWFIKAVGPEKTLAAHEPKIREFVKRAKMKKGAGHP